MNITDLKNAVALLEQITAPKDQPQASANIAPIGAKVIVRSRDAGVLYGEFAGNDGSTISLTNARQIWKWFAATGITLLDVATYGVKAKDCKFSPAQATVTVFNACALIDVTDDAAASIEAVK